MEQVKPEPKINAKLFRPEKKEPDELVRDSPLLEYIKLVKQSLIKIVVGKLSKLINIED